MKHQDYFPPRVSAQGPWYVNFAGKFTGYGVTAGVGATTITNTVSDCLWLNYVFMIFIPATKAWAQACTEAGRQAQSGSGGILVLPVFVPPSLPVGVSARPEGALERIFEVVAALKTNPLVTAAMREDLRIIGPEATGPDFNILHPDLSAEKQAAGVFLGWGWQGFRKFLDQCAIQVDRGTGAGWEILTFDTTPDYTDTHPQPTALTTWKYRAIYHVDDAPVGLWSPVVSVIVGG